MIGRVLSANTWFPAAEGGNGGTLLAGNSSAPTTVNGTVMRVGVRALPPGTYRVRWKVLSVDTHTTEGNFSFRVGQ